MFKIELLQGSVLDVMDPKGLSSEHGLPSGASESEGCGLTLQTKSNRMSSCTVSFQVMRQYCKFQIELLRRGAVELLRRGAVDELMRRDAVDILLRRGAADVMDPKGLSSGHGLLSELKPV